MFYLVTRSLYFHNGKCIGTHNLGKHHEMKIISLPTDHYDFIGPINPIGKTEQEIEEAIKQFEKENELC